MAQIADLDGYASAEDVVVSIEVAEAHGSGLEGSEAIGNTVFRLPRTTSPQHPPPSLPPHVAELEEAVAEAMALPAESQSFVLQVLRSHAMQTLRLKLAAGLRDLVTEFRVCSVLFLGFPCLARREVAALRGAGGGVQVALEVLAGAMQRHKGAILQLRCDEKG